MGSIFRLALAVATADEFARAVAASGTQAIGLASGGADLEGVAFGASTVLVVGHERRGLASWEVAGMLLARIPMQGDAESLNAAVAGSIGLYALSRRCQESLEGPKSQDYRC
jgi:TrmH family RNA methyltransferase